jgi:hypothetical protein
MGQADASEVIGHRSHRTLSATGTVRAGVEVALDVSWIAEPDCRTVEALARLQLAARRGGRTLVLHGPCLELIELVELCGLSLVLPCASTETGSRVQVVGQAEEREPPRGVEEERDPGNPAL